MPMTRLQAELAVDRNPRLRGLGRNREESIQQVMRMEPEEITSRLPAGSPLVRNVTRQRAVSAAMGGPDEGPPPAPPASLAAVRASVPPMSVLPQPAAPAPAAAPAQPAPSKFTSPIRIAAREAERELGMLNYNKKKMVDQGIPVTPEIEMAIDLAERKLFSYQAEANAEEAAQIDPDRAAILARQQGQIKEEEARIAGDVKRFPWEALTQGGLAMMDPERGASFTSALSSGLGTGLNAYTSAKADAIERRARLQKEANSNELQRLDALTQARAAAVAAIRRGEDVDERTMRMAKMTNEQVLAAATQPQRIEAARLAPQVIQAAISKDEASADAYRASADKDRRTDPNLRSTGGDGVSDTARFNATEDAKKKAIERQDTVRQKFKDWQKSANGKAKIRSGPEWGAYESELRIYHALRKQAGLEGVLPDLGATSPGERAAKKARSTSGLPADVAAKYGL